MQGHALPEVFEREVLTRLDTHDTAMLARVSRAARHATVRAGARAQLTVSSSCRTLRMARWGRDNGMPWDWRVCAAAAQAGNLRVLEWARAEGCGFPWDVLCAFAAGGGAWMCCAGRERKPTLDARGTPRRARRRRKRDTSRSCSGACGGDARGTSARYSSRGTTDTRTSWRGRAPRDAPKPTDDDKREKTSCVICVKMSCKDFIVSYVARR